VNAHALRVLEYPAVLDRIAARAASPLARERLRSLQPSSDRTRLTEELARVEETVAFREARPEWSPPPIPDARAGLRRLETKGAVLEPEELYRLGLLLSSGRALSGGLAPDEGGGGGPFLPGLRGRLHVDEALERTIGKTVERGGEVLDSASAELRRIRHGLRRAHGRIVQKLERFLEGLPERIRVSDASVTLREGRYVIPIRREGKSEVGGIIHDESGSGATLFVEPQMAVELMNALRELEREEEREIHRILRDRTRELRPIREALVEAQEALVEFDTLWARATCARAWEAAAPELLPTGSRELDVVRGRHPLLLEQEGEVVPFDLHLGPDQRALVVSGPNTGGKTVFLKALGLVVTLAQSGVIPPVGPGSRLPVFEDVFADIGDEQSIAESLSTFSAHLENLREVVEGAGARSLVLIDEMGTGTDPAEGAALARAILEELVRRDALSVVTSHLGALKQLDREESRIVNASLQFDSERIEPTYRLVVGRPGRSYGLAIARRLGFPGPILDRAERHLAEGEADVEELLERLEREEREAAALLEERRRGEAEVARLQEELEAREAELRERERRFERQAREEARELLLEAREEVEAAIRDVREVADENELEETARRARRRVEEAARRQKEARAAAAEPPAEGSLPDLEPGDRVRMREGGTRGTVKEIRGDRAVVEASGLTLRLSLTELERVASNGTGEGGRRKRKEEKSTSAGGWTGPDTRASLEADLRGLRVHEAELEVSRVLDRAVLDGLSELRIVHGKGTGALREKVREVLRGDGRVEEFRSGRPGEGGTGVTVVQLR